MFSKIYLNFILQVKDDKSRIYWEVVGVQTWTDRIANSQIDSIGILVPSLSIADFNLLIVVGFVL